MIESASPQGTETIPKRTYMQSNAAKNANSVIFARTALCILTPKIRHIIINYCKSYDTILIIKG